MGCCNSIIQSDYRTIVQAYVIVLYKQEYFCRAFKGKSIELLSLRFISELPERFSQQKEGPHL
jgi:hypothetical protein